MRTSQKSADSALSASQTEYHRIATEWVFPAVLLLLFAVQCVWFIRTQSLTFDEPVHIAEGLDAWRNGRFEQYNDHPPLARLLCTLPLLDPKWQVEVQQLPDFFRISRITPDPIALSWRARAMIAPLGLLLGVLLWREVRRHISVSAANIALGLFAFTPSLIAHFSVATTDGAATLIVFVTAIQIERWQNDRSWKRAISIGTVLGLLLVAKFSTLPMFLVACFWLLVGKPAQAKALGRQWTWTKCGGAFVVAGLVLWSSYFFHISHLTIRDGILIVRHPNWKSALVKPTHSKFNLSAPVPAGEYIAGFRDLAFHNAHGQRAFFLGEVSTRGGWKSYYPVAVLLKWPTILLLAAILGGVLAFSRKSGTSRTQWVFFSFPAVYLIFAVFSHFNIGERHILPVYPFALLSAAMAGDWLTKKRLGVTLAGLFLLLNAADALRYAPGYLSYMNVFVNPQTSYQLLSDSNLDWGQGLLALQKYQSQHSGEPISLAYFGSVDPAVYGITAHKLKENEHPSGTVVVSATTLSGQYLDNPLSYRWLLQYKRTRILDHSIYVFEVNR